MSSSLKRADIRLSHIRVFVALRKYVVLFREERQALQLQVVFFFLFRQYSNYCNLKKIDHVCGADMQNITFIQSEKKNPQVSCCSSLLGKRIDVGIIGLSVKQGTGNR